MVCVCGLCRVVGFLVAWWVWFAFVSFANSVAVRVSCVCYVFWVWFSWVLWCCLILTWVWVVLSLGCWL